MKRDLFISILVSSFFFFWNYSLGSHEGEYQTIVPPKPAGIDNYLIPMENHERDMPNHLYPPIEENFYPIPIETWYLLQREQLLRQLEAEKYRRKLEQLQREDELLRREELKKQQQFHYHQGPIER